MQTDRFEWDDTKAEATLGRRGVSFKEGSEVFSDPMRVESPDLRKDYGELRLKLVGRAANGAMLTVIYTERVHRIRIISVRCATKRERRRYEQINES